MAEMVVLAPETVCVRKLSGDVVLSCMAEGTVGQLRARAACALGLFKAQVALLQGAHQLLDGECLADLGSLELTAVLSEELPAGVQLEEVMLQERNTGRGLHHTGDSTCQLLTRHMEAARDPGHQSQRHITWEQLTEALDAASEFILSELPTYDQEPPLRSRIQVIVQHRERLMSVADVDRAQWALTTILEDKVGRGGKRKPQLFLVDEGRDYVVQTPLPEEDTPAAPPQAAMQVELMAGFMQPGPGAQPGAPPADVGAGP